MLVVIAEKSELKLVRELGFENNSILVTGVGGVNVINAMKDIPKNTEIVNIGYVGSNYWDVGTIVEVEKVATNHEIAEFDEPIKLLKCKNEYDACVICYTNTDFVTKTNKKEHCVFDMELAFISAMFDNVRSIKVVSDKLSLEQYRKIQL